jgi:hypothetical protein
VLSYLTVKMKIESNRTPPVTAARCYRQISSDIVARIIDGQIFGKEKSSTTTNAAPID